jgi:hypothetical protein
VPLLFNLAGLIVAGHRECFADLSCDNNHLLSRPVLPYASAGPLAGAADPAGLYSRPVHAIPQWLEDVQARGRRSWMC